MTEPKGRDQLRKVNTGNGFGHDLAAATNDRLELTVIELQNLQKNNSQQTLRLSKKLKTLDESIETLNQTIVTANNKIDSLQKWFLILSILGAIFAAIGLIEVVDILIIGIGK